MQLAGKEERKSIVTGDQAVRLSPQRERRGLIREMLAPSEMPLADAGPIRKIEISYPHREMTLGLTEIPWLAAAIALTMIFSLILGQLCGVRIA